MRRPQPLTHALAVLREGRQLHSFRSPKTVTELVVFQQTFGTASHYVCPRCKITMEREFMNYCDSCGQRLGWEHAECAKIIYISDLNAHS